MWGESFLISFSAGILPELLATVLYRNESESTLSSEGSRRLGSKRCGHWILGGAHFMKSSKKSQYLLLLTMGQNGALANPLVLLYF